MDGETLLNKVIESITRTVVPHVTGYIPKRRAAFAILIYVSGRRDGRVNASFLKALGLKGQEISPFYVSLKEALRNEFERRTRRSASDNKVSIRETMSLSSMRSMWSKRLFQEDMKIGKYSDFPEPNRTD